MATFKSKMKFLTDDWADQIWSAASARNGGKGAKWLPALAAIAVTGVRPASLEKGIEFSFSRNKEGAIFLVAHYYGAKILKNDDGTAKRGQEEVKIKWQIKPSINASHRPKELEEIIKLVSATPNNLLVINYDAEAISTRIRELSKEIWPRKNYHVSGVCYRELFASESKNSGVSAEDLAMAMGHISAESQGKYASNNNMRGSDFINPNKTFTSVKASTKVKSLDRSPKNSMARFKAASSKKSAISRRSKP